MKTDRSKAPKKGITLAKSSGKPPRVLVFDIETTPNEVYTWGFFKQFIAPIQVKHHSVLLCYSAKWLGEKSVYFDSTQGERSDKRCCQTLWELVDEAEIVIAHNGQAFDMKYMNARWLANGMQPPSPYKFVDTLKVARGIFRFQMNKLEWLGIYLGVGRKIEHEGFSLWLKCMSGVKAAWKRMEEYSIQDTLLLEDVYMHLRPWDKRHPNIALCYVDSNERCVVCGSKDLQQMSKDSRTAVSKFPSFRCRNCGKTMRSGTKDGNLNKKGKNVFRNVL